MIGFAKKLSIIAIVLLSASVAYAGDLRPAPSGGNNMHPAPQDGKDNALDHVTNSTARDAIGDAIAREEAREEADKLRRLRPVK